MAISHVKSNTIANFTGTVTVFGSDGATKTAAASNLVLPSDWNSVHNQYMTISGNTVGVSTVSGTNIVLQGGNKVTLSGTDQTIIFSTPDQTVQTQGMVSVNASTGAIVFSNSNGITFGGNASTITASHNGLTTARASNDAVGLNSALTANGVSATINSSGLSLNFPAFLTTARASTDALGLNTAQTNVTWTADSRGISLNASGYAGSGTTFNGANISGSMTLNSVGMNLSLSAAAPGGGGGPALQGSGTYTQNTGTIQFQNSNGVTFGLTNGVMTASVPAVGGAQTGISGIVASNTTFTSGSVYFSNAGNITISQSVNGASQYVQLSGNAAQTVQPMYYSASGTSSSSGTIQFGNTQGVSFSLSNGSVVGSVKTDYQSSNAAYITSQTNQTGNLYVTANSTQLSSTASIDLRSLSFAGAGGASVGVSQGVVVVSVPVSVAQTAQPMYYSASGTSSSSGTLQFGNTQGVSFSLSNGSVVGSVKTDYQSSNANYLTSQSNQAFSAGAASSAFQTLSFNDSNGISFSNNAGAIRITHDLQYTSVTSAITSNAFPSANTTKFAGTGTSVTGGASITLDSLGIKFNGTALAGTGTTFTGTNVSGSMTLNSNGLNLALSVGAGGANPTASASNGAFTFQTLGFSNANNVTFGTSAGSIITASVAAPGAAAENNWMTLLGANVSGNSSASGSTIGLSGINMTLSGTNNSQIVMSVPAVSSLVGASGISISSNGSTITIGQVLVSYFDNMGQMLPNSTTLQMLQSTSHIIPFYIPEPISFGFIRMPVSASYPASTTAATTGNTQFSYGHSRSHNFVIYSRGVGANSQSLQYLCSTQVTDQQSMNISANANSTQFSYTNRATYPSSTGQVGFTFDYSSSAASLNYHTSQMTGISGLKIMDFPWATSLSAGQYFLMYGVSSSTTSQFTNVGTRWFNVMSNYGMSMPNLAFGTMNSATNSSVGMFVGHGSFTTAGGSTTNSLGFSAVTTTSAHNRMMFQLLNIA